MQPRLICSTCEKEIRWADKFCASCGEAVELPIQVGVRDSHASGTLSCKMCGEGNDAENEFCQSCGAPLAGGRKKRKKTTQNEEPRDRKVREPAPLSWKSLAFFGVFLIGGVVALELLTGRTPLPEAEHRHDPPAANMQALPQIEELERKVAAHPNDFSLVLQLANLLHDNRFYEKAITNYRRYLEKNPNDADARVDLGICLNDTGKREEAKREMQEAIRKNPKHQLAHFNLGIVFLQEGDVKQANEWFRKAIDLAPNTEAAQRARTLLAQHADPTTQQTN
ncbi:MAG TPA: tetratricopeptide repeat protein [Bacteroidota bacterium]|nr:tetratricopeptide repeat protein [Bacteroidota bacterium]